MNQILLRGFHQIFDEFQMLIAKMSTALKITEKVSFNIVSEASYVYIWVEKLITSAKNGPFWRVFENLKLAVK